MQNLNTALHEGGFRLDINSKYKFKHPVVIFNYFSGVLKNKMINNSEIINLSKNSDITLIEFLIDDLTGCFLKILLNILILRKAHLLIIILLIKMRVKIFLRLFKNKTLIQI